MKKIHADIPKLSITALAGWSRVAEWGELQGSVDGIFPMFYDMEPESHLDSAGPRPLLDAKKTGAEIAEWGGCKIPWMAGLPSFARLTLFDAGGRSLGTIRQWEWEDVCFNQCLTVVNSGPDGVAVLRVERDGLVAETPVKKGETLVARWPALPALALAAQAAQKGAARGVV